MNNYLKVWEKTLPYPTLFQLSIVNYQLIRVCL